MKHLRKITALLLVLTLAVICFGLASCDSGCSHEYGDWVVKSEVSCTHDGVKSRTCSLCQNVETVTEPATGHSEGDICTACGALTLGLEQLTPNYANSDSVMFRIEDVSIVTENPSEDNVLAIIGDISIDLAELYLKVDGEKLSGYGQGSIAFIGIDSTGNTSVDARVYIDGDTVYYEASGLEIISALTGEMSIGNTVYGALDIEAIQAMGSYTSTEDIGSILGSVINGDAGQLQIPTEKIVVWLEEELAPLFSEVALDVNMAKLEAAINKGIANLLEIETSSEGKTISLNLAELKAWNQELATKTVAELYDELMGEDSFDGLQAGVDDILDYTVEDFINYLTVVQGIKVSELPAALDKLAVAITEDESATFEALIGYEGDIAELLTDEELLSYSVGDALKEGMGALSVTEVKTTINALLTSLEQLTVYNLMGVMDTEAVDYVDQMIDMVDAMVSYVITLDIDGKFVSAVSSLVIPAELTDGVAAVSVTETVTSESSVAEIVAEVDGTTVAMTAEMLVGYTSTEDMTAYTDIKTKVDSLPKVTEDTLTELGYEVEKDSSGNVISAEMLDEWGDYYVLDISSGIVYSAVIADCGNVVLVTYGYNGMYEYREYSSDTEYEVMYSETAPITVEIYYDTESGEIVTGEEFGHAYDLIYDNYDDVSCGETFNVSYECAVCGDAYEESYLKDHEYDYVYTQTAPGVYTESEACLICNISTATVTLTADPEDFTFVGDMGIYEFIFTYNIPTSGTYTFVVDAGGNENADIYLYSYGTAPDVDYDSFVGSAIGIGYVEHSAYRQVGDYHIGVAVLNYGSEPITMTLTVTSEASL